MKVIFTFFILLFGFEIASAQLENSDTAAYYNKIFMIARQQPEFPGGASTWISEHIVYPKQASDSDIQGTVYLSLIIEKDGTVSATKVLKGVKGGSSLDSEAVRVISAMPKWNPGNENGHPVRVQMMLPVNFELIENVDTLLTFAKVQIKPIFPGDIKAWIARNTIYPKVARFTNKQDTVCVTFIVERDGTVSSIQVIKGQDKDLNAEAMKVVSTMPQWSPGKENGHTVRVLCMVPIRFVLNYNNVRNQKPIDTIYSPDSARIIREQPQFPGFIYKWISNHIVYPQLAKEANIQGTVFVSFVVEKDGSVTGVKVLRGVNGYLDNEALRVASTMPKWIPGTENGRPVRTQFMLPIRFILEQ